MSRVLVTVLLLATACVQAGWKESLAQILPQGTEIQSAEPIAGTGFIEVMTNKGDLVFISENGDYLMVGNLFKVESGHLLNVSEMKHANRRLDELAKMRDPIVFAPKGETRAVIYAFTDITCQFCQKMHAEMQAYNDLGIEVRYLAYPRAGLNSKAYDLAVSAWCAKDTQAALDRLIESKPINSGACQGHPIKQHFEFGQWLGVRGTPTMITEDGRMIVGLRTPKELAETLFSQ